VRNKKCDDMKKIICIGLMALIGLSSCAARGPKPPRLSANKSLSIDSVVYKNLGRTLYDLLSSPQKVSCYILTAKENITPDDVVIEVPFVRNSLIIEKMSNEDVAVLQYLLPLDRENYQNDTVIVRSPYLPIIEFSFTKKKAEAHLLVSLSDGTWTLVYDDKIQQHWNYADKRQIVRFCKQFIKKNK